MLVCRGTLMNKNVPVGEVYIDERDVATIDLYDVPKHLLPFELRYSRSGNYDQDFWDFLTERVTPKSRQGIADALRGAGFQKYSVVAITLATHGRDCNDTFWIRYDHGAQTWEEVWAEVGVYNH
mgnify:FL=1